MSDQCVPTQPTEGTSIAPFALKVKARLRQTSKRLLCNISLMEVVSVVEALTSNKDCSDKLMSYTNKGEKGRSILLPKPDSDLEDTGMGGGKWGKLYWHKEIFWRKKILAMIRHSFQSCGAHFYIQRSTSSVPPNETTLQHLTVILQHLTVFVRTLQHFTAFTAFYSILQHLTVFVRLYSILQHFTATYSICTS